jgi:glycerol-3-phosphate dehydrogenase
MPKFAKLVDAVVYYGMYNRAELVMYNRADLALILTVIKHGAVATNYTEVIKLQENGRGS